MDIAFDDVSLEDPRRHSHLQEESSGIRQWHGDDHVDSPRSAYEPVRVHRHAAGNVDGDWKSLGRAPWVLNPPGCPLRARLIDRMERDGFTPMIAAEVHNMHLQLAFVQSGYGVGLLPARFIARSHSIDTVKVLRPASFDLHPSIAIVRVGQLGALEKAVDLLEHGIRQLFEPAKTRKPVTRSRRSVPAKRRAERRHK